MVMTAEELTEMSGTPDEVIEGEDVSTEEGVVSEEVVEETEEKEEETSDAPPTEETKEEPEPEPEEENPFFEKEKEGGHLTELRSFIREQQGELAKLKSELARVKGKSEEDDDLTYDDEDEGEKKEKRSRFEQLQDRLTGTIQAKQPVLGSIHSMMKLHPEYKDIDEIVTKTRVEDMFDALASQFIKQGKEKDPAEARVAAQGAIWELDNPFEWLYGNISKYHPDFAGKEAPAKKEPAKPKEAPSSIADMGSGEKAGEWTAKRIDDLPETELSKVPKDVYTKYMKGLLD